MAKFKNRSLVASRGVLQSIVNKHNVSPLFAQLLFNRGVVEETAVQAFLHPDSSQLHDPFLLPDMQKAVVRIQQAVERGERICIYGDYDADGICATSILFKHLSMMRANVKSYLPSRHQEGYGMHKKSVCALYEEGVRLLITVDNGIAAHEEIAYAGTLGMDVIVTDHHQCHVTLPDCVAVINANRPDSMYPFRALCGAGVALKLVQALGGDIQAHLAEAALATVADIVPLIDENRVLVALGMQQIHAHKGLSALCSLTGGGRVSSDTLAFRLAPHINAAGRMGDANRALALLVSSTEAEAHALALLLSEENAARQAQERRILQEAKRMLQEQDVAGMHAILLYNTDWNPGILGIVASKMVGLYHRPVLLFHEENGVLTGSCRSMEGIDLFEALTNCAGHFIRFGGHSQAAGITMHKSAFAAFKEAFEGYLRASVPASAYTPVCQYEIEAGFLALSSLHVAALSLLAPHGQGNPQPVFRTKGVRLCDVQRMGSLKTHLRAQACHDGRRMALVAFGMEERAACFMNAEEMDILYTLQINEYMGETRLQLQLIDAKVMEPATQAKHAAHEQKFYNAFFYNILYNGRRTENKRCTADMEASLREAATQSISGMLAVASTDMGEARAREALRPQLEEGVVCVMSGRLEDAYSSAHTLLVAPRLWELQAKQYRRILSCDGVLGEILYPRGGFDGELLLPQQADTAFLKPLRAPREALGRAYKLLCALCVAPIPAASLLKRLEGPDFPFLSLAALVFLELELLKWNEVDESIVSIISEEKKQLGQSPLYKRANDSIY